MTKILCYTQNKRVDANYCINECKYAFKQECEPVIGYKYAVEEFRKYLKTVIPCEMPQDIWNLGVDNTCDRMLKEQQNV